MMQFGPETPLSASRMAWRSEPVPLSAFVVTTSVVEVTAAGAVWFVLSAAFVSGLVGVAEGVAVAEAVVMAVPPAFAVAVKVTVAVAVEAIAPRLQVMVVVPLQ